MKILEVTENKDGSCNLEVEFEGSEVEILLEYAVVNILREQIERDQNEKVLSMRE